MKIKDKYIIKEIDYKLAMDIVIKNHYLHRKASCSNAFGLFGNNKIVGVIIYGKPASQALCKGVCGKSYSHYVGELTRLWLDDSLPKNCESYLIGNTIKKQKYKILVSYADSSQNHVGYVYQATNWIYTGLSTKRKETFIEGLENNHCRSIWRDNTLEQLKEKYGRRLKYRDRPRKHRYIYFNCNKRLKKILLKELRYGILPYPKTNIINNDKEK